MPASPMRQLSTRHWTEAPAASTLCRSSATSAVWSRDKAIALPLRHNTARQSPVQPVQLLSCGQHNAVCPLLDNIYVFVIHLYSTW